LDRAALWTPADRFGSRMPFYRRADAGVKRNVPRFRPFVGVEPPAGPAGMFTIGNEMA
jgi:hypothetical protein